MDKEYVGLEKRKFPRFEIPLSIFYRLEGGDPFATHKTIHRNMSGGGLMFETESSIPIGSKMYLEIYQPSVHYKDSIFVISVQGRAIWVNKKEDVSRQVGDDEYQIGVKFTEIEKEDRDRIIELLSM